VRDVEQCPHTGTEIKPTWPLQNPANHRHLAPGQTDTALVEEIVEKTKFAALAVDGERSAPFYGKKTFPRPPFQKRSERP
jgi:hypothetical protein